MRRAMMELFGEDGPLARAIRGYRPRLGQIAMARAVADIRGRQTLEAGTGIGKTFAYLAPILQNGMSAVISTGTRALQDQLFHRDIPFLIKALNRPARATMLKGRSNYVCKRNVAAPSSPQLLKDERGDWARIVDFASRDEEGDIAAAADVAADSPAWGAAVSTRDSCPAQQCDFYENCFLYRARARARQADIIVVNHHLFLADMRLREESVAELLPNRDIVVFDEAHLLPSLAPSYFGESVAAADIRRMLSDIARESSRRELPPSLPAAAKKLQAILGMFLECSEPLLMRNKNASNIPAQDAMKNGEWKSAATELQNTVAQFRAVVVSAAENAPADQSMILSSLASRAAAVEKKMQAWLDAAKNEIGEVQSSQDSNNGGEGDEDNGEEIPSVCWLQGDKRSGGLSLHIAPVSGREIFRRAWDNCKNIVMTSATLTVSGDFGNFARETGMDDANMQSWSSPFDYGRRAMLYLPGSIPDPKTASDSDYTEKVIRAALPLLRANGGRAFVLFSSLRAMDEGAAMLLRELKNCRILKQGDMPNDALLKEFRGADNAVLAGSLSFWQGVDMRGGALSLVVADKIPFSPPTDPLLKARDAWRKKRGENAFMENQLPAAAILMKQVAGRLMRDYGDWGVFMACDPRLSSRGYGKAILNSLPPMQAETDEKAACNFLQKMRERAEGK